MYYPIGWPKSVNLALPGESAHIRHICCDAVKILVAAIGDNFLGIWYANPLIPIAYYRRDEKSMEVYGTNRLIIWKPDSRQIALLTNAGALLLYQLDFDASGSGILMQVDSPMASLRRDSAELFIKENIPRLSLREGCSISLGSVIATVCCISLTELLLATEQCELIRINWTQLEATAETAAGEVEVGALTAIKLREIPFYVHQQAHLKCLPPIGDNAYVASLEYSPFIGGCAAVFSDRRAAFLIANHLRFETANMHGFWVPEVEDATVCSVNHKFRLLAYGRNSSDVAVYAIEDATGGLEYSHRLTLNENVIPGSLGAVNELKWSPDGCVLAVSWQNGGLALWSTFGALLMSTLSWDFGLHVDLLKSNPLQVCRLEWSTEGYQLFMTCKPRALKDETSVFTNVLQLNFVKSALSINPCMASNSHILLQGDNCLHLNQGNNLEKTYFGAKFTFPNNSSEAPAASAAGISEDNMELKQSLDIASILAESKYWTVLQLPQNYAATNWPIRYAAIDTDGLHIAVAGRTGLAHYAMLTKKWKLFGNESQEKDFVVSGGLLWWHDFIVMGCYSLLDRTDEIRCYPSDCKLDNQYGHKLQVRAPVICLNVFRNQLIALTADGIVSLFVMTRRSPLALNIECAYELDVKSICIHPACIVSLTVTNLKNELSAANKTLLTSPNETAETIIVNVCGRILMIQREAGNNVVNTLLATCLASCVECFWLSNTQEKSPMSDCLWLYSGAHGMRVWLPILPPANERLQGESTQRLHTFMSKRIMLSFPLKLYPLVILFDNVIVLGVENETTLYTNEMNSHFSLPFSVLERKSQVYLHKILRQLIKRNLGYSAWEIAKSCRALPYFPHSLELLLHEVLEEEATSKNPIPDALLPSILDFIREFPVYLQTIVQCARKTEIALWPYLFSMAGKPKELFQQCLQSDQLDTAASYLIILQNLEPSVVSKQYATMLLDIALENRKWELAKDLIRFLKAIDPNEIDSPRSSMVVNVKIAPPAQSQTQVNQNPDVFNLILGPIGRERSFSTTVTSNLPKDKKDKPPPVLNTPATQQGSNISTVTIGSPTDTAQSSATTSTGVPTVVRRKSERSNSTKEKKETFCIDIILQRHARSLLQQHKLIDLGYMCAYLDFHFVSWLSQEADRAAKLDDYVLALTALHGVLELPEAFPQRKASSSGGTPDSMPDYNQLQSQFQLDNRCQSSQTSESGYFSLAHMDTPTSMQNGNATQSPQIPSIKEHEELKFNSLPPLADANHHHHQHHHHNTQQKQSTASVASASANYTKERSNSQISFDNFRYRRLYSLQDDAYSLGLHESLNGNIIGSAKIINEKLNIKLRYLLQLFIEANCTDYALVLSILLQDAASIGRIINVVIRSESVAACKRIESALKHLTQWTFECGDCLYRTFVFTLQPHIYLLDQYIQSAAPHEASNGNSNNNNNSMTGGTSISSGNKSNDAVDNTSSANDDTDSSGRNLDVANNFVPNNHHHHHHLHHTGSLNGNWPHDKYPHEHHLQHARLTRHASLESSGSQSKVKQDGTQARKSQLPNQNTGACHVM